MNFIEFETPTKLRGGYYTQPDVAAFLTRWVLEIQPRRLLEPACGDGAFFDALGRLDGNSVETIVAFELDPVEAQKARERAQLLEQADVAVHIVAADFLQWSLEQLAAGSAFDAVIGNPPFVRYQYLDEGSQARAARIFQTFHLPFTKHTRTRLTPGFGFQKLGVQGFVRDTLTRSTKPLEQRIRISTGNADV